MPKKKIIIRRGQKSGVLEVKHVWADGVWVCILRDRKGKRKGSFVVERPEAILLADMLAETAPPLLHHRDD